MKRTISFLLLLFTLQAFAQSATKSLKEGNELYDRQSYDEAEIRYRKALEADKKDPVRAQFNLGDALYKQERYEEAAEQFSAAAAKTDLPEIKAKALHNLGNSLNQQEKYKEAIEAYKNSLKINPDDDETRYNLARTLKQLQQQQQQQQQNDQDNELKPSEYAKRLKERCEALVRNFEFQRAYQLMQEGLQKDKTVAYYSEFIKKLKNVVEIDN